MDIVSRSEWNARPPRSRTFVNWPYGVDLWIHHTTGPQDEPVRNVQDFHMDDRGWNDIGYGYLVRFDGTLYEGRGFEVHAAHSPGKNHEPSVSMLGNYSSAEPSDDIHRSIYRLRDFLDAGELRGHRENSATSCPGDEGMRKIVDGPPPDMTIRKPPIYYFEELPYSEGGNGPVIVGQAAGYRSRTVMLSKLAAFKAAHPMTPVSTLRGGDSGAGEIDETRYYILTWAPNTYGLRFRFGPWRDEGDRDFNLNKRELNTGRQMRPFKGRRNSRYPYPV